MRGTRGIQGALRMSTPVASAIAPRSFGCDDPFPACGALGEGFKCPAMFDVHATPLTNLTGVAARARVVEALHEGRTGIRAVAQPLASRSCVKHEAHVVVPS